MNQSPRTTQNTWIAEITQNTTIIGSINTTKWSKLFSSQMISFSWIKPFLFCSKVNSVLLLHSEWHLGQSSNVHLRWRARNGDPLENDKDFFNLSWRSPSCDLLVNILDSCQRPPSKYSRFFSLWGDPLENILDPFQFKLAISIYMKRNYDIVKRSLLTLIETSLWDLNWNGFKLGERSLWWMKGVFKKHEFLFSFFVSCVFRPEEQEQSCLLCTRLNRRLTQFERKVKVINGQNLLQT